MEETYRNINFTQFNRQNHEIDGVWKFQNRVSVECETNANGNYNEHKCGINVIVR